MEPTTTTPILELKELRSGYGLIEVLKGINVTVNKGEIVTMIGANGAGKTTTLMTTCGAVKTTQGDVILNGTSIKGMAAHKIVRLGMAHSPEGRKIFPRMTIMENLELGAFTRTDQAGIQADIEKNFGYFPILKQRYKQLGGTLSGGEQQMLAIARALMSQPKMLLLDEPSLGLAPMIILKIFEVIKQLNQSEGMSVLLVEQNARLALKLAHRGYVIETGEITMADKADVLLHDPRIKAAYLGE